MDSNLYKSPAETPRDNRTVNLPRLILAGSVTVVLVLIFFDSLRWLMRAAGISAALSAEKLVSRD